MIKINDYSENIDNSPTKGRLIQIMINSYKGEEVTFNLMNGDIVHANKEDIIDIYDDFIQIRAKDEIVGLLCDKIVSTILYTGKRGDE